MMKEENAHIQDDRKAIEDVEQLSGILSDDYILFLNTVS